MNKTFLTDYKSFYEYEKEKNKKLVRACLKSLSKSELIEYLIDMKILKKYYKIAEENKQSPFVKKWEIDK